jgi:fatty acid desaturase
VVETLEQDVPAPTQGEIDREKREARKAAVAGAARLALGGSKDARIRRTVLYLIAVIGACGALVDLGPAGWFLGAAGLAALLLLAMTDHVVEL